MARQPGFPVTTAMPRAVYDLMDLYPQGAKGRPLVLYVPLRPVIPERRETPTTP
jgi:Serine dehydrogenase proteinase